MAAEMPQREPPPRGDGPTFSVVIPTYNDGAHIGAALGSVLGQRTRFPFEVIVVDDGSTDTTRELLRRFDGAVRLISKQNGGPGSARNAGVLAARSDIMVFLDADDAAAEGRFDLQVDFMLCHPDVAVTFGNCIVEDEPGDYLARFGLQGRPDRFVPLMRPFDSLMARGNFITMSTAAARRTAYLEAGMQPETLFYAEDFALWCRIAAAERRFSYISRPLAWYRTRCDGRLTRSPHTHSGVAETLHEMLATRSDALSPEARLLAEARFVRAADGLLRDLWVRHDRSKVLEALAGFEAMLPHRLRRKWRALSLIPSAMPRTARWALRRLRD